MRRSPCPIYIKRPTLSADEAFSVPACEGVVGGLSSIIPDARLEILKGGRHDVSLAEVEALAAAVTACAKPSQ